MDQPNRNAPLLLVLPLLCLGAGAAAYMFWLVDNPQAPNTGLLIAIAFGVFFVTFTAALMVFLRWRDRRNGRNTPLASASAPPARQLEGTIYGLIPGGKYQVIRPFQDYYGNSFQLHEILHFKQRHFLPYHGGHTIVFEERPLYLQEEVNQEVLDHFSDYIVPVH